MGTNYVTEADRLDDALRDILDVITGWTRPMGDAERLNAIYKIASKALEASTMSESHR